MSEIKGCGSHSCIVQSPEGVGVNGPCDCGRRPEKFARIVSEWRKEKSQLLAVINELLETQDKLQAEREKVAMLYELAEHASAGPWVIRETHGQNFIESPQVSQQAMGRDIHTEVLMDDEYDTKEADMRFIVAARNFFSDGPTPSEAT